MLPSTSERFDVKNRSNIFNNYSTRACWIRDGTRLVGYAWFSCEVIIFQNKKILIFVKF